MKKLSKLLMGSASVMLILVLVGLTYCTSPEQDRPLPMDVNPADQITTFMLPDPPTHDECYWTGKVVDPRLQGCGLEIHLIDGESTILVPDEIYDTDFELAMGMIVKLGFTAQPEQNSFCQRGMIVDIYCIELLGYDPAIIQHHPSQDDQIE